LIHVERGKPVFWAEPAEIAVEWRPVGVCGQGYFKKSDIYPQVSGFSTGFSTGREVFAKSPHR
jgi:hypothetical protein